MTDRPVIIVGFLPVLPDRTEYDPDSVILIDEPDVIRKRDIAAKMSVTSYLRELAQWEYQEPGAADEFYNIRPDLNPSMIVPLLEYATPFAARLAERYGVPGATSGAAHILRDKALLRRVTRAAGIANPESESAESPEDVRQFMSDHPGPVVLKPANRQASVGTKVLHDRAEVDAAWAECIVQDEGILVPDRQFPLKMLVERYVRGHEFSVEMLVRDGVTLFANITGKILYPGPRPIELGHIVPAELPDDTATSLRSLTADVLRAAGFATGIVHCEWIISDEVPYLVECAGRFPGDGIAELIERAYPVSLAESYFAVMRGEQPPPMPARAQRGAAIRFLSAEPGEVLSIDGVEAAEAMPGVVHVSMTYHRGDAVPELRSSWDRPGSVLTVADSSGEAMRLAEQAAERIRVEVKRAAPVLV